MSGPLKQFQAVSAGLPKVSITITTPLALWSLNSALTAIGVDPTKPADITVTVANITTGRMTFEERPVSSKVRLINNGRIYGAVDGGTALFTYFPLTIVNNGTIAGGGGYGGYGAGVTHRGMPPGGTLPAQCGSVTLRGGVGGDGAGMRGTSYVSATAGLPGDAAATDAGSRPGAGGKGGSLGNPGVRGGGGYNGSSHPTCGPYTGSYVSGSAGGSAGLAVYGNKYVTWETLGTILGLYG